MEAERTVAVGFSRERPEGVADLGGLDAAHHADGAEVMAMQAFGQPPQDGLIGVGRHALDDQLPAGDAEGDRGAIQQEPLGVPHHRRHGRLERRMAARVHRVPMERDRELHEELAQIPRQDGSFLLRRGGLHTQGFGCSVPRQESQARLTKCAHGA